MKIHRKRILGIMTLLALAAALNFTAFQHFERSALDDIRLDTRATPGVNLLLGGFRGVVADWLWLRAVVLQEQGRFVEILQLAEWITALQPQFPDIWVLHAWNLAYNITVLLPDGSERWRWVRHGYEILRDQAIPATRLHPRIASELAWILMHKIGGTTDDFADTYFYKWVQLYTPLLDDDGRLPEKPERIALFLAEAGLPARKLYAFEQQYGPHDWRHPITHAAAWAYAGFVDQPDTSGVIVAERLFVQTYRTLLFQGKIVIDTASQTMHLQPEIERTDALLRIFEDAVDRGRLHRMEENHLLTVERIIQLLAAHDEPEKARGVFRQLADRFPDSLSATRGLEALVALPFDEPVRTIPMRENAP